MHGKKNSEFQTPVYPGVTDSYSQFLEKEIYRA
jgi:hypothetical protein